MSTRDQLLRAVLAEPDDDTVRLAFADFLDENGEGEWAELIRSQVTGRRRTKLPTQATLRGVCGPVLTDMFLRERASGVASLIPSGRGAALMVRGAANNEYHRHPDGEPDYDRPVARLRAVITRGFVSEVTCSAADWLAHADTILAAHPVTRVTLTTRPEGNFVIIERQRAWKVPPSLGGHVLDCWRAEWPRITFDLPPTP